MNSLSLFYSKIRNLVVSLHKMNSFDFIFTEEFEKWLAEIRATDINRLRLKEASAFPFDKGLSLTQLECRRKAGSKIPELAQKIAYPTEVSIEQCSSQQPARMHASLFKGIKKVADLTCGLGVDSYYISQCVEQLASIDASPIVAEAATLNFNKLGCKNITVVNDTAEHFLQHHDNDFDAAFVDPSRRLTDDRNVRTIAIADTVPSVSKILSLLSERCRFLIVKASPMVDISQTIRDFPSISDIWVLSVKNECKELLFKIVRHNIPDNIYIHCINYAADKAHSYTAQWRKQPEVAKAKPEKGAYLYIPNSSVMKAGLYDDVAEKFALCAAADNSHLYFSHAQHPDYPGNIMEIADVFSMSKADVKRLSKSIEAAMITCRNFPMKPEELRKRLKIKDGGTHHIYATTTYDNQRLLILCLNRNMTSS